MKITRRSFIAFAGIAAAGIAVAPLVWRSEQDLIIGMLRKELPDLRMTPESLSSFAERFLLDYKSKGQQRRTAILTGVRVIESLPDVVSENVLPGAIRSPIDRLQSELFNAFFLGTDYLDVYDDPERQVTFFFIPDPYVVGCSNRLAQYE